MPEGMELCHISKNKYIYSLFSSSRGQCIVFPIYLKSTESDIVVMPEKLEQKYVMVPEDVKDGYLIHMIKLLIEEKLDEKDQIVVFSRTCKSVQVRFKSFTTSGANHNKSFPTLV